MAVSTSGRETMELDAIAGISILVKDKYDRLWNYATQAAASRKIGSALTIFITKCR
jgi:hypothetical protein